MYLRARLNSQHSKLFLIHSSHRIFNIYLVRPFCLLICKFGIPLQQAPPPLLSLCWWDYIAAPLADIQQHSFRVWSFRHGLGVYVVSIQHWRRLSLSSSSFLLFSFYIIHMTLCISLWSLLFMISKVVLADEITSSSSSFLKTFLRFDVANKDTTC